MKLINQLLVFVLFIGIMFILPALSLLFAYIFTGYSLGFSRGFASFWLAILGLSMLVGSILQLCENEEKEGSL